MRRRELLKFAMLGPSVAMFSTGCPNQTYHPPSAFPPVKWTAIDAHCHVFNAKDIPATRFIHTVILHVYPRQAARAVNIDDPDIIDALARLFLWLSKATNAPTAREELKVLDRIDRPVARNENRAESDRAVIDSVAGFLSANDIGVADDATLNRKLGKLRRGLFIAAGQSDLAVRDAPATTEDARQAAELAYRSKFDLGVLLRWFGLFTRYRHSLSDQLSDDFRLQAIRPALLCPAMVDYDYWLGEYIEAGSTLPDQVAVMGRIARRKEGAVVHGYVAFDPLRQAAYDIGYFTDFSPSGLVRRAIEEEGFLGVKLYPPMGFRAFGNATACQSYPMTFDVIKRLNDTGTTEASCAYAKVGSRLDAALAGLYDYCQSSGAAVIAHANNSNQANMDFGKRADPAYWIGVFERWPRLSVLLAHFGSFKHASDGNQIKEGTPVGTWEWRLGEYIQSNPEAPVFTDFSYLDEIFKKSGKDLATYASWVRRWIATFDPHCEHLVFGTDWLMLAASPHYPNYVSHVKAFFGQLGLNEAQLKQVFYSNAIRFLGLRAGDQNRQRLEKLYKDNGVSLERLPAPVTNA